MSYTSPEYGKSLLSKLFEGVIVRDYSKIEHCKEKYPIWGICVLGYSSWHNDLNARIHYLPSNKINFEIEISDSRILSSTWKNEEVDDSVYEYFIFIIEGIMNNLKGLRLDILKFQSKDWIERQQKLTAILNESLST